MIQHLENSTDTVKSNKKLLVAVGINTLLVVIFLIFNSVIAENKYLTMFAMTMGIISTSVLFYQIIKKI